MLCFAINHYCKLSCVSKSPLDVKFLNRSTHDHELVQHEDVYVK